MQTLKQALSSKVLRASIARCGLDGCPVGAWGESEQAMARIREELPHRSERAYTVGQIVEALYSEDSSGRYRAR